MTLLVASAPTSVLAEGAPSEKAALTILGIGLGGTEAPKARAGVTARVPLNTAPLDELRKLPGVHDALAKRIIAGRPYASVRDLCKAGVPRRTIDRLEPLLVAADAVWVNTSSGIFHRPGDHWYGKTSEGVYMTESEALKAGYRPLEAPQTTE